MQGLSKVFRKRDGVGEWRLGLRQAQGQSVVMGSTVTPWGRGPLSPSTAQGQACTLLDTCWALPNVRTQACRALQRLLALAPVPGRAFDNFQCVAQNHSIGLREAQLPSCHPCARTGSVLCQSHGARGIICPPGQTLCPESTQRPMRGRFSGTATVLGLWSPSCLGIETAVTGPDHSIQRVGLPAATVTRGSVDTQDPET